MVARETSCSKGMGLAFYFYSSCYAKKIIPVQTGTHNALMKLILDIHIVYKPMCVREIHTYTFH